MAKQTWQVVRSQTPHTTRWIPSTQTFSSMARFGWHSFYWQRRAATSSWLARMNLDMEKKSRDGGKKRHTRERNEAIFRTQMDERSSDPAEGFSSPLRRGGVGGYSGKSRGYDAPTTWSWDRLSTVLKRFNNWIESSSSLPSTRFTQISVRLVIFFASLFSLVVDFRHLVLSSSFPVIRWEADAGPTHTHRHTQREVEQPTPFTWFTNLKITITIRFHSTNVIEHSGDFILYG